ncbi:MAG: hypothetical protein JW795_03580 [Chitinivibrionales bacterium]|nr:hypothetical protein [Chitinivibrionales bacterium]
MSRMVVFIRSCMFIMFITISPLHSYTNFPFPQAQDFKGCIKPALSQEQLNKDVISFYEKFKKGDGKYRGYLRHYSKPCDSIYYIAGESTGDVPESWGKVKGISNSEATGYGMIIFALMGGHDKKAQLYFNGLLDLYLSHKSSLKNNTMSWIIPEKCIDSLEKSTSATDGDLDIAYGLILAYKQWGSQQRDYIGMARALINDIIAYDIGSTSKRLLLGDWNKGLQGGPGLKENRYNESCTRPSDWLLNHLKLFKEVDGLSNPQQLDAAIAEIQRILPIVQNQKTGLVPDFVEDINAQPKPVVCDICNESGTCSFLEGEDDNDYYYNACRVPWRLTTDFAHYNTAVVKTSLTLINQWSTKLPKNKATEQWPEQIWHGYTLDGKRLRKDEEYTWDLAFVSPLITALIIDPAYKNKLTLGWNFMKANFSGDHTASEGWSGYFSDAITLLCMLLISGNWFNPMLTPSWQDTISYTAGSDVLFHEKRYRCGNATKGENPETNASGVWKIISRFDGPQPWEAGQNYPKGTTVLHGGNSWKAIENSLGKMPADSAKQFWKRIK